MLFSFVNPFLTVFFALETVNFRNARSHVKNWWPCQQTPPDGPSISFTVRQSVPCHSHTRNLPAHLPTNCRSSHGPTSLQTRNPRNLQKTQVKAREQGKKRSHSDLPSRQTFTLLNNCIRSALTAQPKTPLGPPSPTASISALTVPPCTATWASTSHSSVPPYSIPGHSNNFVL